MRYYLKYILATMFTLHFLIGMVSCTQDDAVEIIRPTAGVLSVKLNMPHMMQTRSFGVPDSINEDYKVALFFYRKEDGKQVPPRYSTVGEITIPANKWEATDSIGFKDAAYPFYFNATYDIYAVAYPVSKPITALTDVSKLTIDFLENIVLDDFSYYNCSRMITQNLQYSHEIMIPLVRTTARLDLSLNTGKLRFDNYEVQVKCNAKTYLFEKEMNPSGTFTVDKKFPASSSDSITKMVPTYLFENLKKTELGENNDRIEIAINATGGSDGDKTYTFTIGKQDNGIIYRNTVYDVNVKLLPATTTRSISNKEEISVERKSSADGMWYYRYDVTIYER